MANISKADRKFIDKVMKRLKKAVDADAHNRTAAIEDLNFINGEQWSVQEKKRRSDHGRPALTLNFLPKFVDQVVGDMLHNTPSIKIRPIDSRGDINIAKIRQGIISGVEYQSNSKGIYGYAGKQQVSCGYGAWRVLTRYTEENPFLQEIYLEGVRNPFLVYLDPSSKDQNYADAKWGFILEKMSKSDFEDTYPDAELPSENMNVGQGLGAELWYDGNNTTVAEYFEKVIEKVMMHQLDDGRVVTVEEYEGLRKEWKKKQKKLLSDIENQPLQNAPPAPPAPGQGMPPQGMPPQGMPPQGMPPQGMPPQAAPQGMPPQAAPQGMPPQGMPQPPALDKSMLDTPEPKIAHSRETDSIVMRHWILTRNEILSGGKDGKKFPGKYVPLVILKGKELNIEGKNYVYSLIRNAKDPQKLINYWNTAAAETIALTPKAPWLMTAKQIEGHERSYAEANIENNPVLIYNVDDQAPGAPARVGAGQPPVAIFEQIKRGEENLKSVIGMFNADIGASGSEQTGAAINARQRPGDIATFEFSENMARAITYTGRIINEMIPEIYDTERDVRVRNFDESETFVPINTTVKNAMDSVEDNPDRFVGIDITKLRSLFSKEGKDAKYNDVTSGKYDVVVTTGPSYATQRQESTQHLLQLVQSMPQQMALAADILVENMDFKDCDVLAARLRKILPPGMVKPRQGETPTPPPPNPQMQLAQLKMQGEQSKQQLQMMKLEQEKVKLEHEKIKMQLELAKLQVELKGAGESDQSALLEKMSKAQSERERVQLERDRFQLEKDKFDHQQLHDIDKHRNESKKIDYDIAFRRSQQPEASDVA